MVATTKDRQEIEGTRPETPGQPRYYIARTFVLVEDIIYVGLGLLLAVSAAALLVGGVVGLWRTIVEGTPVASIIALLDRILLVLMTVELLYTVQISFRQHALLPEPFLIVGLIAAIRRVLVITAELSALFDKGTEAMFQRAIIELAILTVMVVAFVAALLMLRKRDQS